MNVIVQSGQGRLHAALEQPGVYLGHCGSRITRPQAVLPMDWDLLSLGPVPVCRYCLAIADAVHFQQLIAAEAAADALQDGLLRRGAA
jgi:hypothetical protein